MNEGWKDIVFFYDLSQAYANMYPLNNGWVLGGLSAKEKKNIFQVFSKVGDQISRIHYTRFIAWRKMRIELLSELANVRTDNRFFIPEVLSVLNDSEVFVDCGAHVGSVSKKFVGIVKNRYRNMYIIEPDKINFSRVKKEFSKTVRTKLFKLSLGSKYGIRKFHEGFGFASKLSKIGNTKTKVSTLDSMKIPATFIKMHLEGGELDALRGATKTIRKFRPIIAVTLYHNSDGVFKIPLLLMSITNKYRYLIRTHSWAGTGVILYAIPNERNK
jgi:FkbM family methyltransferase